MTTNKDSKRRKRNTVEDNTEVHNAYLRQMLTYC